MERQLRFTTTAKGQLAALRTKDKPKHKKVTKTLGLLQTNPRHSGLNTHPHSALEGPSKETVYEAYVENNTPSAYRVFFYNGPDADFITIVAITPHP